MRFLLISWAGSPGSVLLHLMRESLFTTLRLQLRPTGPEDAGFVLELFNTPQWLRYIGDRQVGDLAQAEAYIKEKMLPQQQRLGYGSYTIIRQKDQRKIGTCGLYDREGLAGVDIGFALLPTFIGQGYAYEAARCLLDAGFKHFGLDRIGAITTKDNISSQRLLTKLGLSLRGGIRLPEDEEELLYYSKSRTTAA